MPYGWCWDHSKGCKIKYRPEQEMIALICRLYSRGNTPFRIARQLNEMGKTTRNERPWSCEMVIRILQRAELELPEDSDIEKRLNELLGFDFKKRKWQRKNLVQ
jgi:hypothetical protein